MASKVFLDTGGIAALALFTEPEHKTAVKKFEFLVSQNFELMTTDYVLSETATLLRCRFKLPVKSMFEVLHNLYISDLTVVEMDRHIFGEAMIFMHKFQDHYFSLTDCTSFVVMKKLGIKEVFTTDKDFEVAGFENLLK